MIKLAYFEETDFKQLMQWINTEELLLNWSGRMFSFPLTEESLSWYLSDTNDMASSEAFIYKAIDEAGNVVGHISLGSISTTNKSARISRVYVDAAARGKGICSDMVKAVLEIGFEQLKLHRISLGVYDTNKAATACYEKAGLKIEGIHRHILLQNGVYWSNIEMAILEDEWRAQQQLAI